jgi:hypothetical protein
LLLLLGLALTKDVIVGTAAAFLSRDRNNALGELHALAISTAKKGKQVNMDDRKWMSLCETIMKEIDPDKLLALVDELNKTLEERGHSLLRSTRRTPAQARCVSVDTVPEDST